MTNGKSLPRKRAATQGRERPDAADYRALAEFRYTLRRFLEFSEDAAREVGLTPRQHQALLAIKGFRDPGPMTVRDLAEQLRVRHNSAVELVDRLADAGLVSRQPDREDQRRAVLVLTGRAEKRLAELSTAHLEEIARIEPELMRIVGELAEREARGGGRRPKDRT